MKQTPHITQLTGNKRGPVAVSQHHRQIYHQTQFALHLPAGCAPSFAPTGSIPAMKNIPKSLRPVEHKCIGFKCKENDYYCIDRCPQKALTLRLNPVLETLGDYRWTAEMLIAHWEMAETGNLPRLAWSTAWDTPAAGFDKIRFRLPDPADYLDIPDEEIDLGLDLNKRKDGRPERRLSLPCYSGGMSYGSMALHGPHRPGQGRGQAEHAHLYRRRRISQGVPPLRR